MIDKTKVNEIKEKFDLLNRQMEAAKKVVRIEATKIFRQSVSEFFSKYPQLESFSWTQYTPYFNDGDECTFSAHIWDGESIGINGEDGYDVDSSIDGNEWKEEAQSDISSVLSALPNESFQDIFGDHVRVIVTKDGVDTEDYNHD